MKTRRAMGVAGISPQGCLVVGRHADYRLSDNSRRQEYIPTCFTNAPPLSRLS